MPEWTVIRMAFDNCQHCGILDDPRSQDIESEDYFTCSDCACYGCEHLHSCEGQCRKGGDPDA